MTRPRARKQKGYFHDYFSTLAVSKYLNLLAMQDGSLDNKQALMQK